MSRQLDAAIAEALGWEVERQFREKKSFTGHRSDLLYEWKVERFDGGGYQWYDLPYYSTDAKAVLELDKEMRARGWCIDLHGDTDGYRVYYYNSVDGVTKNIVLGKADTEPPARALAAYKALTGKEWQD